MDEKQFQEITNKMDLIIRLLALDIVKDLKVQKEKIVTLSAFGFAPSEIANLLGTTPNTVRVALSEIRKKAKKEEHVAQTTETQSQSGQDVEAAQEGEAIA